MRADRDNEVQLPAGAEVDLDQEPPPQEREELVRFAAEDMRVQDERDAQDKRDAERGDEST